MSELQVHPFEFRGSVVHTLTIGERPAWIAREIGETLGYAREGRRLVSKIKGEWADDLLPSHDFDVVVGDELEWVKAEIPTVAPAAKGVVVLYESGLDLVLVKSQMPHSRELRQVLVDEVLPQLPRSVSDAPERLSPLELATLHEVRLAARVELDDRKFRANQLRDAATTLFERGQLDAESWHHALTVACEIALDAPFPAVDEADRTSWVDAQELADTYGWGLARVLGAASSLDLLDQVELTLPVPIHDADGWRVAFRFSPVAVLRIEAWLDDQLDLVRGEPSGDRAA